MNQTFETFYNFKVILVVMNALKLLFILQKLYYYRKGGSVRDRLLKLDVTSSHWIVIVFSFLVLFQSLQMAFTSTEYLCSLLACVLILQDQPFFFQKLKSERSVSTFFSCSTFGCIFTLFFSCSLIGIAYTILFSMFPYIAKWVLLIFALNLLPSIVNNAKKNTKPLWLLGKILSEGGTYAYLQYMFGDQYNFYGLKSDSLFLTTFVLIQLIMMVVYYQQSVRGGRVFKRFMTSRSSSYSLANSNDRGDIKMYEKVSLLTVRSIPSELSEANKKVPDIVILKEIIDKAERNSESQIDCVICLENLFVYNKNLTSQIYTLNFKSEEIAYTSCRHLFHPVCLDTWLVSHKNCPYCRFNLQQLRPPSEVVVVQ